MTLIVTEELIAGQAADDDADRWLRQFSDAARFEIHPVAGEPHFQADTLETQNEPRPSDADIAARAEDVTN